jgi:hypothetical protein
MNSTIVRIDPTPYKVIAEERNKDAVSIAIK